MKCPACNRDVPYIEGQKYCPFCGADHEQENSEKGTDPVSSEQPQYAGGLESEEPVSLVPDMSYCPWEDQDKLGFAQSMWLTVRDSMLIPERFFSEMPTRGGFVTPLLYALIVQTVGTMVGLVWAIVLDSPMLEHPMLAEGGPVILAVIIPFLLILGIFAWAALLYIGLLIVTGSRSFEAVFRIICYTSAPDLFSVIPYFGGFIGLGWKVYITVIAIREVCDVSMGKAIQAMILPLMVCCGLTVMSVAFIGSMATLS